MIFVEEELVDMLNINPKYLNYPELLYDDTWYALLKKHI